jgi:hypothetical protein
LAGRRAHTPDDRCGLISENYILEVVLGLEAFEVKVQALDFILKPD